MSIPLHHPGCLPFAFLPGSVGGLEVFVIFAIILVLFGPRRLPEIARSIGKVMHDLRNASDDFRDQIMRIDEEPLPHPPVDVTPDVESAPSGDPLEDDLGQSVYGDEEGDADERIG